MKIRGLIDPVEFHYGDVDAPPPDWRAHVTDLEEDDDDDPSEEDRAAVANLLGFDPLDDDNSEEGDKPALTLSAHYFLAPARELATLEPEGADEAATAALAIYRRIARIALRELRLAVRGASLEGSVAAARRVLERHQPAMARALTDAQIAAALAGMRDVARRVEAEDVGAAVAVPASEGGNWARWDADFHGEPAPGPITLPLVEEAVAELRGKRLLLQPDFVALSAAARARAFTLAGAHTEEAVGRVRDAVADAVESGQALPEFRAAAETALADAGVLSAGVAETVFRTAAMQAYSDGQEKLLEGPVGELFPYARYDAIHDDRVRPEHLAMEKHGIQGTNVYRRDDRVFKEFTPPWSWNCRCMWSALSVRDAADLGINEAKEWLRTNLPPLRPAFVERPPFAPPPGFGNGAVMLSALMAELDDAWVVLSTFDESEHPRDHGQFAKKAGTAASAPDKRYRDPDADKGKRREAVSAIVGGARAVRDGATVAAAKIGKVAWDKLTPKTRDDLSRVYAAVKYVEHKLESPVKASQALVKQVAKERGLPEAHVDRVARITAAADGILRWTVNVPGLHAALDVAAGIGGLPGAALAKLAYYMPVGSLTYLAYSTLRNPLAVLRAARTLVAGEGAAVANLATEDAAPDADLTADLLAAFDGAADPEWFEALLLAALDETGDVRQAMERAQEAAEETPEAPEGNDAEEEDGDVLELSTAFDLAAEVWQQGQSRTGKVKWYNTLTHETRYQANRPGTRGKVKEGAAVTKAPTKKPAKAPAVRATKPTTEEAHQLADLYLGKGGDPRELMDRLSKFTLPQLAEVKKKLEAKIVGVKAVQVKKLAETILGAAEKKATETAPAKKPAAAKPLAPVTAPSDPVAAAHEAVASVFAKDMTGPDGTVLGRDVVRHLAEKGLSKSQIDDALTELAERGDIVIHRHDHTGYLPPEERAELPIVAGTSVANIGTRYGSEGAKKLQAAIDRVNHGGTAPAKKTAAAKPEPIKPAAAIPTAKAAAKPFDPAAHQDTIGQAIDKHGRGYNLAPLYKVRRELPHLSREQQDAAILHGIKAGHLSGSALESGGGIAPSEEEIAGTHGTGDDRLGFLSRKNKHG